MWDADWETVRSKGISKGADKGGRDKRGIRVVSSFHAKFPEEPEICAYEPFTASPRVFKGPCSSRRFVGDNMLIQTLEGDQWVPGEGVPLLGVGGLSKSRAEAGKGVGEAFLENMKAIAPAPGKNVSQVEPVTTAAFLQEGVPPAADGDAVEGVFP